MTSAPDPIGKAMLDFLHQRETNDLIVHSDIAEDDLIPIPYLFRTMLDMPELERVAIAHCKGHVLDGGAGAGPHALQLQQNNLQVTAIDTSPGAVQAMRARGVRQPFQANLFAWDMQQYDTILLLMNGIGVVNNLDGLRRFFKERLPLLLQKDGQLLLDSSDLNYLYEEDGFPDNDRYYGEVNYQMEYKDQLGEWFGWLYVDFDTLSEIASECNLHCERLLDGPHHDYLARITFQ